MKNKILIITFVCLFLFSMTSIFAEESVFLGTVKLGDNFTFIQTCNDATYITLSTVQKPSGAISINTNMTFIGGGSFAYNISADELGSFYLTQISDGCENTFGNMYFEVTSTGDNSSLWFIIIVSTLAVIFFISSLITPEEFFVYVSGIFFLLGGIYLMINGFGMVNGVDTRYIAYVYLGIGILFTVGAYIFNYVSKNDSEEEEY